jgi:small subunit ribosomal protein S9
MVKKTKEIEKTSMKGKYTECVGRRKESVARVRIYEDEKGILINGKTLEQYFPNIDLQESLIEPLKLTNQVGKFGISIKVNGGGLTGQAESARLGIARLLDKLNPENHTTLKMAGFLTRDPRMVERKKFGLHKARRAPQ